VAIGAVCDPDFVIVCKHIARLMRHFKKSSAVAVPLVMDSLLFLNPLVLVYSLY